MTKNIFRKHVSILIAFALFVTCAFGTGFAKILANDVDYMNILSNTQQTIRESLTEEGWTFLKQNYQLMPSLRDKNNDPRKATLLAEIDQYVAYIMRMREMDDAAKKEAWKGEIETFTAMLPYIKPEIGEDRYLNILDIAHSVLIIAANSCRDDRDCEDFLWFLSQESLLFLQGEENKYAWEINNGYTSGVRGVISTFAFAKEKERTARKISKLHNPVNRALIDMSINEDAIYPAIMMTALKTFLDLKRYGIVEDIIVLNDKAEVDIKHYEGKTPISGVDIFFPSTYVAMAFYKDVMTSYPAIKHLPSIKARYLNKNDKIANVWWNVAEMLKADGSEEANNVLVKIIKGSDQNSLVNNGSQQSIGRQSVYEGFKPVTILEEKSDLTGRVDRNVDLYGIKMLRVSALVNVDKSNFNLSELEEIASLIINTVYADLSMEEEYEMDIKILEAFPGIRNNLTEGAIVNEAGRKLKKKLDNRRMNLAILGHN